MITWLAIAGLAAFVKVPPFHTIVLPGLVAVRLRVVVLQVKLPVGVIVNPGTAVFWLTAMV